MAVTERAAEPTHVQSTQHRARRRTSWKAAAVTLTLILAATFVTRIAGPENVPWLQNMLIIFESLLIEALPFVLLGALVSAAIEVFVPDSAFARLGRMPKVLQLPSAAVAGMAFPVCECGSVPVARRLASKGLSTGAAITFMLSAPVVNPVVVASTFVAYRGRDTLWQMVLGRIGLGLLVAMCVGWVVSKLGKAELIKPRPDEADLHEHDGAPGEEQRWRRFSGHLAGDFLFMGRYLMMGAFAAAALQTFVPQSIIGGVASLPVISLLAMMLLAFLLSLCSESDAFVAASFVQFGVASQLAFLVFGPMVDFKLGALYAGTFNRGFVRTVTLAVGSVTLVATMWIQVWLG